MHEQEGRSTVSDETGMAGSAVPNLPRIRVWEEAPWRSVHAVKAGFIHGDSVANMPHGLIEPAFGRVLPCPPAL